MARNIYMLIAYDGTEFHGWQYQIGQRTVQGVLEETLRHVVRHDVDLVGCGRTDAGVHAAGHVNSFRTTCAIPEDRLRHAIGARLATDLAILDARDVHAEFNARRSAASKLYRYRIYNATRRPVEHKTQRHTYHCWHRLDVDRMRDAATRFVGEMDFTAMTPKGVVRQSMVRTVLRCDVERHLSEVRIDVEGTGFLYNQVRNIAGTLLEIGRGLWEPQRVSEILESRDRANAGPTAPAKGLCLQWVRYPPHLLRPVADSGKNSSG